jgi:hypothetical protein
MPTDRLIKSQEFIRGLKTIFERDIFPENSGGSKNLLQFPLTFVAGNLSI